MWTESTPALISFTLNCLYHLPTPCLPSHPSGIQGRQVGAKECTLVLAQWNPFSEDEKNISQR